MRNLILGFLVAVIMAGCAGVQSRGDPKPQEVIVRLQAVDPVSVQADNGNHISRSMEVKNNDGYLSALSFICGDRAFIKIFSGLSVADVTRFWNDIQVLLYTTDVRKVSLFLNSPGGEAFSGLALADEVERAQRNGFNITAYASGIVASAAVPIFAVCDKRIAAPGTIFMVHEAALWKWPGRETASDIRSQNNLMTLLQDKYLSKLAKKSSLDFEAWKELERKTTWFSAEQAQDWGLVDTIE